MEIIARLTRLHLLLKCALPCWLAFSWLEQFHLQKSITCSRSQRHHYQSVLFSLPISLDTAITMPLKHIPFIISPDLLKTLCEMGHGDTIGRSCWSLAPVALYDRPSLSFSNILSHNLWVMTIRNPSVLCCRFLALVTMIYSSTRYYRLRLYVW